MSTVTYHVSSRRNGLVHYATLGLVSAIAQSDLAAQPFMIGAWVDHLSLSPGAASVLALSETLCLVVAMFSMSAALKTLNLELLGIVGSLLAAVGQVGSALTDHFVMLEVWRCIVGAALGVVGAAANAASARTEAPERAFGVSTAAMVLLFSALSVLLSWASSDAGPKGIFLVLTLLQVTALPAWFVLKRAFFGETIATPSALPASTLRLAMVPVMVTMLLLSSGIGAVAAFSERIGHAIGLDGSQIGVTMSGAYLVSLLGPFLVTRLGLKWGHFIPMVFGLTGCALSCAALGQSSNSLNYAVALTAYNIVWWFGYSYLMGIAAAADPNGRLVTLTGATYWLGSVVGTGGAGLVASTLTYTAVGGVAAASCALAIATIWKTARRVDGLPAVGQAARPNSLS